jgi:hypothetical protein
MPDRPVGCDVPRTVDPGVQHPNPIPAQQLVPHRLDQFTVCHLQHVVQIAERIGRVERAHLRIPHGQERRTGDGQFQFASDQLFEQFLFVAQLRSRIDRELQAHVRSGNPLGQVSGTVSMRGRLEFVHVSQTQTHRPLGRRLPLAADQPTATDHQDHAQDSARPRCHPDSFRVGI